MELSGKLILFESEEEALVWFKAINETKNHPSYKFVKENIEKVAQYNAIVSETKKYIRI